MTYQGKITGHFTDFLDVLAIFSLKALPPEKYRDNAPIPFGPTQINFGYASPPPEFDVTIDGKSEEGSPSEIPKIKEKI